MKQREVYEHKLQTQLDEWNAAIDQLKVRADQAEADAKVEYDKHIDELRQKQQIALSKLEELRQAGDEAWENLKADVEAASNSLGESVNLATARFK
ncbi:MAG: coiled coil domain-containing protein [Methylobacter sp.]|uniref:coiled coil domain-containing protein n=1 Tax=Methylobacter sp. TaxID=2051955 RepID=UPI00258CF68E|nr:coiled coil domain-containing protein [Methylobacter sp.]MCL7419449.1 coiled coil domain-containing protein [Methylobacter sp.]